jgi:hypothetical protein
VQSELREVLIEQRDAALDEVNRLEALAKVTR